MSEKTDKQDRQRNPYGDELNAARVGFGSDVSSQRLTPFEEEIIERAALLKKASGKPVYALDLFSGHCAANARRLAELGFQAYAVDFNEPADSLVPVIGTFAGGGSLHYLQQDARILDLSFLPAGLDLVTGQRGLHFLPFREAKLLVAKLASKLNAGASIFLSVGAVDCMVGGGYKHTDLPVEERWHPLEPELGGPIHVTEPLCLYKDEDIEALFADLDGSLVSVGRDDFGLFIVEFKAN